VRFSHVLGSPLVVPAAMGHLGQNDQRTGCLIGASIASKVESAGGKSPR
jgi:hypothetical protein